MDSKLESGLVPRRGARALSTDPDAQREAL